MVSEGRPANTWSCACNTSRAADADDTTTAGTWPRRMSMTGPCAAASERSDRCGRLPSWWRLPMTGSPRGEGGGRRLAAALATDFLPPPPTSSETYEMMKTTNTRMIVLYESGADSVMLIIVVIVSICLANELYYY